MTAARRVRAAVTFSLLGAAAAMPAAFAYAQAPEAHAPWVDGFCLPLSGGYVPDADTARFLRDWKGRPAPAAEAEAARPVGEPAPGQLIRFADASAPDAFVDARRGVCTLAFPGPALPKPILEELFTDRPPVGENGAKAGWVRIVPAYGGPPPAPRYLLPLGGREDRGVCVERLEDLRRRDGAPISVLRMAPCRLAPGEKLDG